MDTLKNYYHVAYTDEHQLHTMGIKPPFALMLIEFFSSQLLISSVRFLNWDIYQEMKKTFA